MGLGAFLAGVLLADSEFRHELEAQIEPFEGLLLGLFFMAVGMSIDLQQVAAEPLLIARGVATLLAVKFAMLFALGLRPGRLDVREALMLGGVLALGGEFAFVVFGEARQGRAAGRACCATGWWRSSACRWRLTPLLLIAMSRCSRARGKRETSAPFDADRRRASAGAHRRLRPLRPDRRAPAAWRRRFRSSRSSTARNRSTSSRRFGNQIYYGDPARPELLRSAGARAACACSWSRSTTSRPTSARRA